MWYEILIKNEFADYFINSDPFTQDTVEKQRATEMLEEYSKIIDGVSYAWDFYDTPYLDRLRRALKNSDQLIATCFDFCCSQIHLSKAKSLPEIWHSISTTPGASKYSIDLSQLNAEQCAILIMYPFWSRMGNSFEKDFQESGRLKLYLTALKNKSLMP